MGKMYPNIDMEKTGKRLKWFMQKAGYDVKYIQNYLQLACPQPVYRWFKGKNLPTVDHLYALSRLFGVHMEELLVPAQKIVKWDVKRLICYYQLFRKSA